MCPRHSGQGIFLSQFEDKKIKTVNVLLIFVKFIEQRFSVPLQEAKLFFCFAF